MDSRILRWATGAVAVVAVLLAGVRAHAVAAPAPVRLHVALTKAEPGINDTVSASPAAIKLWFSEPVQAAVTGARITGPGDRVIMLGTPRAEPGPKPAIVVPLSEKLASGKYAVAWKTMAEDGHPASGTFSFLVRLAGKKPE